MHGSRALRNVVYLVRRFSSRSIVRQVPALQEAVDKSHSSLYIDHEPHIQDIGKVPFINS